LLIAKRMPAKETVSVQNFAVRPYSRAKILNVDKQNASTDEMMKVESELSNYVNYDRMLSQ